ncbi:MAG: ATP-binding protein [Alphaproteobacteria bacterium]|jgi:hypothetical protein|nr:ATP-binding protein [Alphaproteobacteria bacterium]
MVYAQPETSNVQVGAIHQDQVTPAFIMVNDLLAKHFAILGTTGSGKSCSVALILRKILTSHPAGHVVLLDPHNEYRSAFEDLAEVVEPQNLSLPCWLLTIDEIASVMVRAGDEADQQSQVNILKDAILESKKRYASKETDTTYYTPDTPVP